MLVIKNFAPWKKLWLFCLSVLKSFRLWPIQEKPIFHKLNKFSWSCLCDSHNYFFSLGLSNGDPKPERNISNETTDMTSKHFLLKFQALTKLDCLKEKQRISNSFVSRFPFTSGSKNT